MEESCPLCLTSLFVQAIEGHTICTKCGTVLEQSAISTNSQMNFSLNDKQIKVPEVKQHSTQQRAILLSKLESASERREYQRNKKISELTEIIGGLPTNVLETVRKVMNSVMELKKGINLTKLFLVCVAYITKQLQVQSFNLKEAKQKLHLERVRHFYALQRLVVESHSKLIATPHTTQEKAPTCLMKLKHIIRELVDLHRKTISIQCKEMREFLVKERFKRVSVVKGQSEQLRLCLSSAQAGWNKLKQLLFQKAESQMNNDPGRIKMKEVVKKAFSDIGCNLQMEEIQELIDSIH